METLYYILSEDGFPNCVSEKEHDEWVEQHASKFYKSWITKDGVKEAYLRFVGEKEKGEKLNLFEVETIFKSYDGEIINYFNEPFSSYKKALEHYEDYIQLNGD